MIKKIGGVAIATGSIAVMAEFYKSVGLEVQSVETDKDQKVKVATMKVGESQIQLFEPVDDTSPVARFIEQNGEGVHHICLEVEDLQGQLDSLKEKNVKLIDSKPRVGLGGRLSAYIDPESTGGVLVELVEQPVEQE